MNLTFPSRDYFLDFFLAWSDVIDTISHMSNEQEILNLNGFSTYTNPTMHLLSLSLLGGVTFLGYTVIFSMSNSYWLTYKISSEVRILVMSFSDTSSVSLTFI